MQGINCHNIRMTYTGFQYEFQPYEMVTLTFPGHGTITMPIPILNAYEERIKRMFFSKEISLLENNKLSLAGYKPSYENAVSENSKLNNQIIQLKNSHMQLESQNSILEIGKKELNLIQKERTLECHQLKKNTMEAAEELKISKQKLNACKNELALKKEEHEKVLLDKEGQIKNLKEEKTNLQDQHTQDVKKIKFQLKAKLNKLKKRKEELEKLKILASKQNNTDDSHSDIANSSETHSNLPSEEETN